MLLALLVVSWPALYNGAAFFFPDTPAYLRGAGSAIYELTGWETDWSDRHNLLRDTAAGTEQTGHQRLGDDAARAQQLAHPVLLGRSVYYGLLIFPFVVLFGSMGGVMIQAGLTVLVLWITLRALGLGDGRRLAIPVLATATGLAALTSLPFYVSLLMPDIFTGFAVAMGLSALIGWRRLNIFEKSALLSIACFAAMSHSSNVLILGGMLGLGLLILLGGGAVQRAAIVILAIAATSGIVSERIFVASVEARLGEPPIRPPFLTARLVNEGPALKLLREKCPQIALEACRFQDRMPRDSDTFLWSREPTDGVFSVESHAVQRRLADQDSRLALETLRAYPFEVIYHSALASGRQLLMAKADIFNLPPSETGDLPPRYTRERALSRSAAGEMPMKFVNIGIVLTSFLAAAVLLLLAARGRSREHRVAAFLLFGTIFANALIAGALSKPHNRYNTRLLWVLPLAAGAILLGSRRDAREVPK